MSGFCATCEKPLKLKSFHKKRFKGPFCCSGECRGELLKNAYKGSSNPNLKFNSELEKLLAIRCADIQRRARAKKLDFNLTTQHLVDLYFKQNGLCAYSGIPLKLSTQDFKTKGQADIDVISVDKVEPSKGYLIGNVVLCCSGINKLKGNASPEEVQAFISALGLKSFGTCKIKFKKLRSEAKPPIRSKLGDGGFDLSACYIEDLGDKVKVYTGIACEPDFGWVLLALPRSSIVKSNLRLANSVGLIDNQYRGEILAVFDKKGNTDLKVGDRIIQLVPVRLPHVELEEVSELNDSERGAGGFGSTGK